MAKQTSKQDEPVAALTRDELEEERRVWAEDKDKALAEIRQLKDDLLSRDKAVADREQSLAEREAAMKQRQDELSRAATPGQTMLGVRGRAITVKRGDYIIYDTQTTHEGGRIRGGWLPCSPEDAVSRHRTMIGQALHSFNCDDVSGAPMHSIRYFPRKQYFKDPDISQVLNEGKDLPEDPKQDTRANKTTPVLV